MALAVSDIFVAALRTSWQQRRALFDIALLPIICSLVIDLVFEPMLVDRQYTVALQTNPSGVFIGILALFLLSLLPLSAFAVGWTRHCLIGQQQGAPPVANWTMREMRYFGATLKLLLVYSVCVFVALLIAVSLHGGRMPTSKSLVLIGVALLFAVGYVLTRLSLVLPAAAVDLRLDFVSSLRYSQGNGWRLFAVLILLLVLAFLGSLLVGTIVTRLLALFFAMPFSIGPRLMSTLIGEIASYALMAPLLAALALGFRSLTGWQPNGAIRPLSQPGVDNSGV
jgi:hypothetical protein